MPESKQQIFLDKIRLAWVLISKEMDMISHVNSLKSIRRNAPQDLDRIHEYEEWRWAWHNLSELYDFLKFSYLDLLEKKDKDTKDDLVKIMKKHDYTTNKLTYEELLKAQNGVLKMMALSKFHDVAREGEGDADFLAEED